MNDSNKAKYKIKAWELMAHFPGTESAIPPTRVTAFPVEVADAVKGYIDENNEFTDASNEFTKIFKSIQNKEFDTPKLGDDVENQKKEAKNVVLEIMNEVENLSRDNAYKYTPGPQPIYRPSKAGHAGYVFIGKKVKPDTTTIKHCVHLKFGPKTVSDSVHIEESGGDLQEASWGVVGLGVHFSIRKVSK